MKSYNGFTSPERSAVGVWQNQQWRAGRPRPTKCCACGVQHGVIDSHCEDYSQPYTAEKLFVYPLCFRCHMLVHCRFSNPDAWNVYRANIRAGVRFAAFRAREFGRFCAETLRGDDGCTAAYEVHEPPSHLPLDIIQNGNWPQLPDIEASIAKGLRSRQRAIR
jgi:hypothetical protein